MEFGIGSAEAVVDAPVFILADAAERRRQTTPRPPRAIAARNSKPDSDEESKRPAIELVLYVSSISPHSTAALRNLRRALAEHTGPAVKLTVHDLSKDPQRGIADRVHFTPTLVRTGTGPRTWIVGHLGNPQVLQALLDSALEPPE
jgi:KaiB domain